MNNKTDKYLDKLVNKMMKDVSLESPSEHFETNVMTHISGLSAKKTIAYKPLISKSVWILLASVFIAFMAFLIFGVTWQESESVITIDFDVLFNNSFAQALNKLKFSNIFSYTILSLALMLLVQVTLLKNYFDKRLTL